MPEIEKAKIITDEEIAKKISKIDEKKKLLNNTNIGRTIINNETKIEPKIQKEEILDKSVVIKEEIKKEPVIEKIKIEEPIKQESIVKEEVKKEPVVESADEVKKEEPVKREYIPYSELRNKKSVKKEVNNKDLDSIGIFKNKKTIFYLFITPPIIISLISFFHLITFYESGNPAWIALAMAFAIEIASIVSLLALVFLHKIKRLTIILLFGTLLLTQLLGNCFFSFIYLKDSELLVDLLEFFFNMDNNAGSLRLLSFIVSGIPVIISLTFIKSAINMFRDEE